MTPALASRRATLPMLAAAFVSGAAVLAAVFPVAVSIGAVFVFAGPHNWLEARYFVARLPVRWGRQRGFFLLALSGVAALSLTFSLVPVDRSIWHIALVAWAICLTRLSHREALPLLVPVTLAWAALACLFPNYADLALVYLHPLAALWFVRRQIAKSLPQWLPQFRILAMALPIMALFVVTARAGEVAPGAAQVTSFVPLASSTALVALHAFLELLHYGAWVLLLPAIGLATRPWNIRTIPLVRRWPKLVAAVLALGAMIVLLLWVLFAFDYQTTRGIYFSVAIVHVLVEVPFLIWLR